MHKIAKISLISLSVLSIILLCAAITFYVLKESEKEKNAVLQKRVDETISEKQALEDRSREMEMAGVELRASIKALEEKVNASSQALEKEKAANVQAASEIMGKELDIQSLKAKVESVMAEKQDVLKRIEKLNEDYLNMKAQAENLLKMKEELEKKIKEFSEKENVSLGTIVIKQPAK